MKEYRQLQEREVNVFLKTLLEDPKEYDRHVHRCAPLRFSLRQAS